MYEDIKRDKRVGWSNTVKSFMICII